MTEQAASFFRRTRIPSPCGAVKHDPGHPIFGLAGDRGPEDPVDVFVSLSTEARREVYAACGNQIYAACVARGLDVNALLSEDQS